MADKKQYYEDGNTPVPSYDEYKELVSKTEQLVQKMHILEKKLKIAKKALKKYMTFCRHPAEEALKEIEEVK